MKKFVSFTAGTMKAESLSITNYDFVTPALRRGFFKIMQEIFMTDELIIRTTEFFRGDARRIQHFMKVYTYAALIGRMEGLDDDTMRVLEAAAVVHDTGIKKAEELYGYNNGKLQEQYGPEAADALLKECGYGLKDRERVCYLVAHHHTYTGMDGADYRILVEADFLVNMYEDDADINAVNTAYDKIFTTESGKMICRTMYGLN